MFGKNNHQVDLELFTIFDSKVVNYREPILVPNKEVLMRELLNMFEDPGQEKNPLYRNAEDFTVFRIGTYDRKTGELRVTQRESVFQLHELKALADLKRPVVTAPGGIGPT